MNVIAPEKIDDITIGDIVTIHNSSYIMCNEPLCFGYSFISTHDKHLNNIFDISELNIKQYIKDEPVNLKCHVDIAKNIDKIETMFQFYDNKIQDIVKVVRYFTYTSDHMCVYYYPFLGKIYHTDPTNLIDIRSALRKSNDVLQYSYLFTTAEKRLLFRSTLLKSVPKIDEILMECADNDKNTHYTNAQAFESFLDIYGIKFDINSVKDDSSMRHYKNNSGRPIKEVIEDFLKETKSKRKFGLAFNDKGDAFISDTLTDDNAQFFYDTIECQYIFRDDILGILSEKFLFYID